jgi:hypothetical protein
MKTTDARPPAVLNFPETTTAGKVFFLQEAFGSELKTF